VVVAPRRLRALPEIKEFTCKGLNCSVTLGPGEMTVKSTAWGRSRSHELPLQRVNAVIVQRKSVVPFAAFTILSGIAVVLARYNGLWFMYNLTADEEVLISDIALLATILFAIPTISRILFVDVLISWGGRPKSFLIRFVSANQGRRLTRLFQRLSTGT
jgi:hypothetical protein